MPVSLIQQLYNFGKGLGQRLLTSNTGKFLGSCIHVVNQTFGVSGNDSFSQRFKRDLCLCATMAQGSLNTLAIRNIPLHG